MSMRIRHRKHLMENVRARAMRIVRIIMIEFYSNLYQVDVTTILWFLTMLLVLIGQKKNA